MGGSGEREEKEEGEGRKGNPLVLVYTPLI